MLCLITGSLCLSFLNCASDELKHASKLPVPKGKYIDQFGQDKFAKWPEKVQSIADLKALEKVEQADLAVYKAVPDRDLYQAWTKGPQLKATGFFRLEKLDEKWWLVAPNGHIYYSLGIDCVGAGAHTPLHKANRAAIQALPGLNSEFKDAYNHNRAFSFYICNLIRKWGKTWRTEFEKRAIDRCKSWGFTCFANWSDDGFAKSKLPYLSTGPAC
ncbi:MAG: hypothetical protein K2X81_20305, partial [Candidatus Obscuribacterales bacterium]|nr:hypothetical protein [Candidatus Obscuribacterales bacterium]